MKKSKRIAWNLARDLGPEELSDKEAALESIYLQADSSEQFKERVFEVGAAEIAKQCRKLAAGFKESGVIFREEESR